jgi:hypothetical protein
MSTRKSIRIWSFQTEPSMSVCHALRFWLGVQFLRQVGVLTAGQREGSQNAKFQRQRNGTSVFDESSPLQRRKLRPQPNRQHRQRRLRRRSAPPGAPRPGIAPHLSHGGALTACGERDVWTLDPRPCPWHGSARPSRESRVIVVQAELQDIGIEAAHPQRRLAAEEHGVIGRTPRQGDRLIERSMTADARVDETH